MAVSEQEGTLKRCERSGSVILDVESLTQLADKDFAGSPKRNISRKGSCNRAEKKAVEREIVEVAIAATKGLLYENSSSMNPEKSVMVPINGSCNSPSVLERESSNSRCRRLRRSTWLDPRRIVLIFATLSSMGTIILIYFTLAMSKINTGDESQITSN
ncbi:uncharacterized protein LOC110007784 isoform X2 [Amborella trichopoda]|nr:uncharacterized protein LOC110007784 isoform X2 [Amborella trichopoda]|eukprot:XP_020526642.1 uncharacterized protein LOC110007784 isoform X2 [Amborella trichopoda]